ncbi:MAG: tyrosine-type recombinase/integrase [Anaerolineales bacterium]
MDTPAPISDWLAALGTAGIDPKTLASYRRGLEHFISWNRQSYGADFAPAAVIQRDVVDWRSYQQAVQGARPASINQRLAALSSFFKWAAAQGLVTKNPLEGVKSLGLENLQPKALDKRAERLFLRAVHQSGSLRDIAIVELLLGTGVRVTELLNLCVGDVEIGERSGKLVVRKGKDSGHRDIPLTVNVRKALTAYLEQNQARSGRNDSFWAGQRGDLQDRSAINRILEKYALLARVEPFGPHVCRHTFATRYLENNPGDLRGLASLLGHRSLNTVMIYTEPTLADLAGRMENI